MTINSKVQENNTFKILIASDIHLGVYEKNPILKEDSFEAFQETLEIGNRENVDFVLLGGDLFHENMPSREILFKTYNILNNQIYGPKKFNFSLTSNPKINFPVTKEVNYTDPNIRIKLPIFSINGNHDNPVGSEALAVLDLLNMNRYVNYFGKITDFDRINISPLLFEKGTTKLAVYRIGSIRDERFRNFLLSGSVNWDKPGNHEEYFKILVIHQNRNRPGVKGSKTGDAVNGSCNIDEYLLPNFFDLVIWGHEHESRMYMEPAKYPDKNFKVIQPGSTVQTSISQDEMMKKKVGVLTVMNKKAKITPINLKTPRDLLIETLNIDSILRDNEGVDDEKVVLEDLYSIAELKSKLKNIMLKEIDRIIEDHVKAAQENAFINTKKEPLVRVRIQTQIKKSVFTSINLANDLEKRIANPTSAFIVLKKPAPTKEKQCTKLDNKVNETIGPSSVDLIRAADLKDNSENSRDAISNFLKKVLKEQLEKNNTMEIFSEVDFLDTFEEFVKDLDLSVINSHFLAKNESVIKMIHTNKNINNINELKSICIKENKLKREKEDDKVTLKRTIEREWRNKKATNRAKVTKKKKVKDEDESCSDINITNDLDESIGNNNANLKSQGLNDRLGENSDESDVFGSTSQKKIKGKRKPAVKKAKVIKKLKVIDVAEKEKEEIEKSESFSFSSQYIDRKDTSDLSSFMVPDEKDEELPKFEKYE